jgi:polyisoprenoid-binding protein YceI
VKRPTDAAFGDLTGDYVFDAARTRIGFVARHVMATKVHGQFDEFAGSAHLDGDDAAKSSAQLTIQAKSIQTRHRLRDEQLRGNFLDIDNHPTMTFTSTTVEQVEETNFKVTGDLTIRGVTKPVTVDVKLTGSEDDPGGDFRVGLAGSVTINRNDWGVNWNIATRVTVSKKVTLQFEIAAIRQS